MGHLKITAAKQEERIFFPIMETAKEANFHLETKVSSWPQPDVSREDGYCHRSLESYNLHLHAAQFHFRGDRVSFHWS